jgi:hypothetical protein
MIPVQLYVVAQVAVFALPSVVFLPRYPAPIALLVERLSLVSAILACAVLAAMRLRPLHGVAIAAIATVFFGLVHRDTAMLNRMEEQAERLVRTLPPGQRVLGAITAEPGSRIWIHHLVARACVGHCFAYGNYEPVSGQFRVRARPGSPITLSTWEDALATESGRYVVRSEDMVIYQVHRCSGQWADVCLRGLAAGEVADHTRMPARRPAR